MRRYLTPQLAAELTSIHERIDYLNGEVLVPGRRASMIAAYDVPPVGRGYEI